MKNSSSFPYARLSDQKREEKRLQDREELEMFKREISIIDYAERVGYYIDHKKSSVNHYFLRSADHIEKILIKKSSPNLFIDVETEQGGTIIDFVGRETENIGEIRKKLRAFLGGESLQPFLSKRREERQKEYELELAKAKKRATRFISYYSKIQKRLINSSYLNSRGILDETLFSPAFIDKIHNYYSYDKDKVAEHEDVLFPIENKMGVISGEKKNPKMGLLLCEKNNGLWISNNSKGGKEQVVENLIICEHPIDCLSHYQLFYSGNKNNIYTATMGNFDTGIRETIHSLVLKYKIQNLIIAVDNDKGGGSHTVRLIQICKGILEKILIHKPSTKDFNNDLKDNNLSRKILSVEDFLKK